MTNILIADDHDLVRDTIAAYLGAQDEFESFMASDLDEALEIVGGVDSIDLMILDYNMPGMNGLAGLLEAKRQFPTVKVVLMSGVANRDVASSAMLNGADGFLPKSLTAGSMINALKFVLSGERYVPFEFLASSNEVGTPAEFASLSKREMETLEQLCTGLSNKEIALKLGIREVTVKLHVKNVLAKLSVSNRTQAALLAKEAQVF